MRSTKLLRTTLNSPSPNTKPKSADSSSKTQIFRTAKQSCITDCYGTCGRSASSRLAPGTLPRCCWILSISAEFDPTAHASSRSQNCCYLSIRPEDKRRLHLALYRIAEGRSWDFRRVGIRRYSIHRFHARLQSRKRRQHNLLRDPAEACFRRVRPLSRRLLPVRVPEGMGFGGPLLERDLLVACVPCLQRQF